MPTIRNDKQATSTDPSELAFPPLTPNSTTPHGMSSRRIRDRTVHEIAWNQPKRIINVTLAEHPNDVDLVDIARSRKKTPYTHIELFDQTQSGNAVDLYLNPRQPLIFTKATQGPSQRIPQSTLSR